MRPEKVIITYGRMRVIAVFEPDEARYTDPNIASVALREYPSLGVHSCINSQGPTFRDVIENTSFAHLLEHLMIAEQSMLAAEKGIKDVTFVGNTHWVDEARGIAEVQVSFIDDLDAISALSKSLQWINRFCHRQ